MKDEEHWPSLNKEELSVMNSLAPDISVSRRRHSVLSPQVLTMNACAMRRKAISSKMNSSTGLSLQVIPKDQATFGSLQQALKNVELFSFLSDEQRSTLVNAMFPVDFEANETIMKEGDQPDNFYILASGTCTVWKKSGSRQIQIAELNPGQYFGELALIGGSTRSASVIASSKVKCWAIDQTTYLSLLKDQHSRKRQCYRKALSTIPFLKVLQDYEILLVADALLPMNPPKGSVIVKQGDQGDEFFILLEGECRVKKSEENGELNVGTLRSGAYFGELALINESKRAASVIAGTGCKLAKLDRLSFHRLLGPCSQIFIENMKLYELTK
jgi:cAMP-dependent protein kinase regulator